jgi:putative ABC transport system ATP-binding protein
MTDALVCQDLVHVYRADGTDVAALRGIDLVVRPAARVALLGESGSGKSTLLSIASGLVRPSAGRVEIFGVDVGGASEDDLADLRGGDLGMMLQGASTNLLLHENALGNIEWAVRGRTRASREVGYRILDEGGVALRGGKVGTLSPAEQQITALAVVMAGLPRLLLADEPTSRLDETSRDRLLDLLVDVTEQTQTAVLVVTHDAIVANRMQRMIHLREGRIGEEENATGRYSVVSEDGAVHLPEAILGRWPAGSLVSVKEEGDEIRITRAEER